METTGYDASFTLHVNRLFKIVSLWFCLYPALVLAACQAFYWLKFARFLDLATFKIAPGGFAGFFYALTNWAGLNILIHKFFALPLFITWPVLSFCLVFLFYESALAIYFLLCDSKRIAANFTIRILKIQNPDRRAEK